MKKINILRNKIRYKHIYKIEIKIVLKIDY
jgi:hypothetical protein